MAMWMWMHVKVKFTWVAGEICRIYESDVNVREGEIIITYVLPSMWMCVKVKYASIYIYVLNVNMCEGEIYASM